MTAPQRTAERSAWSREIKTDGDLSRCLAAIQVFATQHQFKTVETSRMATAASELGRNILKYATSGRLSVALREEGRRLGVQVTAIDHGPGIADIDDALKDHFTTGKSLGLGLPGVRRITDEFDIESQLGAGVRAQFTIWRN